MRSAVAASPAAECRDRALTWAETDVRVSAALVYGSVAHGTPGEFSDLDLLIVARRGQRDALWRDREEIALGILGGDILWSRELPWQRSYRFQAWRDDLAMTDLTIDETDAEPWQGIADGFDVLIDRDNVVERLRFALTRWRPPPVDVDATDAEMWPWFFWLAGRIERGAHWFVRTSLHQILNERVLPLLGTTAHDAEHALSEAGLAALNDAAPSSSEPDELRRALRATVQLYDRALGRWAERTGEAPPEHPLSPAIRDRLTRS